MAEWELGVSRYAHFVSRIAAPLPVRPGNARSGFMKLDTALAANYGLLHPCQSAKA
jgi:hypothetical protein